MSTAHRGDAQALLWEYAMLEPPFRIPDDAEIERERERRQQSTGVPSLHPPPTTVATLLAECEEHRRRIVDAIREGQRFYPGTNAHYAAIVKGEKTGFLPPSFGRLFDAALALDLGNAPAFPGEPQTGRDAIASLDALTAWCQSKQQPASADSKQKLKQPPDDAIKCYRLFFATGWKQAQLAEVLSREFHRPIDQPTVSRWIKQVKAWLKTGNVLPDLTADGGAKPKVVPMEPAKIDRSTGRQKSIRRNAELEKLIAEQQAEDDY